VTALAVLTTEVATTSRKKKSLSLAGSGTFLDLVEQWGWAPGYQQVGIQASRQIHRDFSKFRNGSTFNSHQKPLTSFRVINHERHHRCP